ncbi:hypothetical protein ACJMK2_037103 [Sinanodonta woodiana]|uniref:Small integral membrane protein 12 n=1 Tax=Sinanodonta woodiana TaxID=1069815 RepID=A0ABD3WKL5_SINWO
MWPIIMGFMRTYAVYLTWPVAAVVGFIGYNTVEQFRNDTPWREKSVAEERDERKLKELENIKDVTSYTPLQLKNDVPKTVLGRNDIPKH